MSLELIMTQSGALGHATGSTVSGGAFVVTSAPSTKSKAEGAGVYSGPLQYTFSGGSAAGFVSGTVTTVAPAAIPPTAVKSLAEGLPVIRLGDQAVMVVVGLPPPPATATVPVPGAVTEVANAGQQTVKGS